jgi:hypothetical protein
VSQPDFVRILYHGASPEEIQTDLSLMEQYPDMVPVVEALKSDVSLIHFEDVKTATRVMQSLDGTVTPTGTRVRLEYSVDGPETINPRFSGRDLGIVLPRSLYGPGRANYSREELRKQLVAALPSVPMKIVFGVFYWLASDLFAHAPILKMSGSLPGEFAFTAKQSMMPGPSPSTVSSSMGRH